MAIQTPDPFSLANEWADTLNSNFEEIRDRLSGISQTEVKKEAIVLEDTGDSNE